MREKTSLRKFTDPKGILCPIEFDTLPFGPKRIFYVINVPAGIERGNHAHHTTQQLLICLQGQIEVKLFDGSHTQITTLNSSESIYVPAMIWDSQTFLTGNDVLLSLASTKYDPNDYINDRNEFIKLTNHL